MSLSVQKSFSVKYIYIKVMTAFFSISVKKSDKVVYLWLGDVYKRQGSKFAIVLHSFLSIYGKQAENEPPPFSKIGS